MADCLSLRLQAERKAGWQWREPSRLEDAALCCRELAGEPIDRCFLTQRTKLLWIYVNSLRTGRWPSLAGLVHIFSHRYGQLARSGGSPRIEGWPSDEWTKMIEFHIRANTHTYTLIAQEQQGSRKRKEDYDEKKTLFWNIKAPLLKYSWMERFQNSLCYQCPSANIFLLTISKPCICLLNYFSNSTISLSLTRDTWAECTQYNVFDYLLYISFEKWSNVPM